MSILAFSAVIGFIPFMFVFVVAVVVIVVAAKAKNTQKRNRQGSNTAVHSSVFTDGNGRTEHQRDYLNGLRSRLSERKIAQADRESLQSTFVSPEDGHTHIGDEQENYEKIVGSLGEVNDEGCEDLDGVRLIVNDISYDTDDDDTAVKAGIAKVMVFGDILNTPRFKSDYRKK